MKKNAKTEVCFYEHQKEMGSMLRVAGKIEFLNDKNLKGKAINDRPFLKSFGMTAESPELVIFRIVHGEVHFWTMENNLKTKRSYPVLKKYIFIVGINKSI